MSSLLRFLVFVVALSAGVTGLYFWRQAALEEPSPPSARTEAVAASTPEPSRPPEPTAAPAPSPGTANASPTLELQTPGLAAIDGEIRQVVASALPSVVAIDATPDQRAGTSIHPIYGLMTPQVPQQTGTGVVASTDGYIITNRHVVEGAGNIRVTLHDGRSFPATLIGSDPASDIAVLRIEAGNLTPANFSDSDAVEVGQLVFAIGNPYGLRASVTQGIVSAKGRRNDQSELTNEFIQTDADVNPGNSGGPLVSTSGGVLGINNHIYSRTGSSIGIGFAIPSNVVQRVYQDIISLGRVQRPFLGVAWEPMSPSLARQLALDQPFGLMVTGVVQESAAERAGIQPGDVIWGLAGKPVKDFIDFRNTLAQQEIGDEISIRVVRDGEPLDLNVLMEESPATPVSLALPVRPPGQRGALDGIVFMELNNALRQRLRIAAHVEGVLIRDFQEGAPATEFLLPGDVLVQVGSKPVRSIQEARYLSASLPVNQPYSSVVFRRGQRIVITLDPRA